MRKRTQLNFAQRWRAKLKEPKKAAIKRRKLIFAGIAAGLVIVAAGSLPWIYEYRLAKEIEVLNQNIRAMQDLDSLVYQLEYLQGQVEKQEQLLRLVNDQKKDPSVVLNLLQENLPAGSTLESFTLNADNSLEVSITFLSPLDVARFWSVMKDSEHFETEDIDSLSLEDKEQTIGMKFRLK